MGMCASQARLLMLTARKDDLQFRMMQITNAKMMLAMQTEEAATKYSDALNDSRYTTTREGNKIDYGVVTSMPTTDVKGNTAQKYIVIYKGKAIKWHDNDSSTKEDSVDDHNHTRDGKIQERDGYCWNKNDKEVEHIVNASPDEFEKLLENHDIQLQMYDPNAEWIDKNGNKQKGGYVPTNISSNQDFRENNLDEGAQAIATAEYEALMAKINAKEKLLDIEAEQIETQQNAVTTEIESVQNLVKKESERTFKYFS